MKEKFARSGIGANSGGGEAEVSEGHGEGSGVLLCGSGVDVGLCEQHNVSFRSLARQAEFDLRRGQCFVSGGDEVVVTDGGGDGGCELGDKFSVDFCVVVFEQGFGPTFFRFLVRVGHWLDWGIGPAVMVEKDGAAGTLVGFGALTGLVAAFVEGAGASGAVGAGGGGALAAASAAVTVATSF